MIGRRSQSDPEVRVPRKDRRGANPFVVGALTLTVIAVATFFGFTKANPFANPFKVDAVVTSAVSIRTNSPVRIAGVNVGKVTGVRAAPGSNAAIIEMEITDRGLPIHKDATLKIRPRIFLEGNFFVDLQPGTPSSPTLGDGDTIPVTQTAVPVQLDQVLTALQSDSREDLQTLLQGFGTTLTAVPTAEEDAAGDPRTRGKTAAEALNAAARDGAPALRGTSVVNTAFLGERPDDIPTLVRSLGQVSEKLAARETQLQDFVTNFNTTMAALASESAALGRSINILSPTLRNAESALGSLNDAFPSTRAFAREILPGVKESAETIDASFPWMAQTRGLLGRDELRGQLAELSPTIEDLAAVADRSLTLLPRTNDFSQCITKVILPTGDVKILDGALTAGVENYKEFWYAMVGLAGEGQNFDGNGPYVRFQAGGGDETVSLGEKGSTEEIFGNTPLKPLGTRPAYTNRMPPYVTNVACKNQRVPDLNSAKVGPADGQQNASASARATIARQNAAAARRARQAERARSGGLTAEKDSVTAQLVSRLNPFRDAEAGR